MPASIKISEDTSALARAISNATSSIKLSDDLTKTIQAIKHWNPILKKDIEKAEDINLSTDSEPKEIDEKDCQKEK